MDPLNLFVQRSNFKICSRRLEEEEDDESRAMVRDLLLREQQRYGFHAEQLGIAEEQIREARERIIIQTNLINQMSANGGDTTASRRTLDHLIEALQLFEQFRLLVLASIDRSATKLSERRPTC
jgi:hypothetical protein